MSMKDQTILITGASRGIGRAIALRCAREGANIVIASKTASPHPTLPGTIQTVAAEVEAAGGRALPLVLDVRNEERVYQVVEEAVAHFGRLSALVNNAGAIFLAGTESTPMKRFDLMHQVNVRGTYLCAQAALPHLKANGGGHILNLSPPMEMESKWFQNHVAYTLSKFGMSMCTLGMAAEFRDARIAVNSLWPKTIIATDALKMVGGPALYPHARSPEIMADAAFEILATPGIEWTGNHFLDEEVLKARGKTAFEHYAMEPGSSLMTDLFVSER